MLRLFVIGLGGAVGTVLRYIMGGLDYKYSYGIFPVSTFLVNVTGSLAIGFLWGTFDRLSVSPNIRLFIFIGVLGGYTTFSTFSLETFNLMRDGEYKIALMNIFFSVGLSIVAVFTGYFLSKTMMNISK